MRILTLTIEKFQDLELVAFLSILKASNKFSVFDFYSPQNLTSVIGQFNIANINTKTSYSLNDYDILYIPGGYGAKILRQTPKGIQTIKEFIDADKYVIAICDAPNAINDASLIKPNQKYISWSDGSIKDKKRIVDQNINFYCDKKLITGRCPVVTIDFAYFVLEILFGKDFSLNLKKKMMGSI